MLATRLPRLYAILDGEAARLRGVGVLDAATSLRNAGVLLLQYRDKKATKAEILETACAIGEIFEGSSSTLILNDWPLVAVEAGWDGVHVGQSDVAVAIARRVVGNERLVGVSTHSVEQFQSALTSDADYIAFGPIFGTTTKLDAEPAVGLEGLKEIRKLSERPVVAIGGISLERVKSVFAAGADSVAVVGALFEGGQGVRTATCRLLQRANSSR